LRPLAISVTVLIVLMLSTWLGSVLNPRLPKHHLSDESKAMVMVGIGFIATLAALVLGLLLASAKSAFDTKSEEIEQAAARIILLDRNLRQYGSAANPARDLLRGLVSSKVDLIRDTGRTLVTVPGASKALGIEEIQEAIRALSPSSDAQWSIQTRSLKLAADLAQTRWLLVGQAGSAIATPFLIVLVLWLAVILGCLSLVAPRNGTVIAVSFLCALSFASAIFLLLEMDRPFEGLLRISDAPLRSAVKYLNE